MVYGFPKQAARSFVSPITVAVVRDVTVWSYSHRAHLSKTLFLNATAQRLIQELDGTTDTNIQKLLKRLGDGALTPQTPYQSGVLHQRIFVRWWRSRIDAHHVLTLLFEITDYQQSLLHQAFIGQLGHELRTPLTALIAHSEVAVSAASSDAVRQSSLVTIQHESQRMARLVRDMLELHKLETSDSFMLHPTNVVLVAEEAVAQLILYAEDRGVDLVFEADTQLPLVFAQPDRLKQVFLNVTDNAIKYCHIGNTVRVILTRQQEGVACVIQDDGPGIAAVDLPHITELLYRSRRDVEGYGIGLALVKEILHRHNAPFTIESSTDPAASGTTCRWVLPFSPEIDVT